MPTIADNRSNWDDPGNWLRHGEEWSSSWGTTAGMWLGTILPRLGAVLPTDHLLELAFGHGRVTERLLPQCRRYTGVDLAPSCVAHCRDRFAAVRHAAFHGNEGATLPMVADASVDLAFSWDSLVHAEAEAVLGYVAELGRVLRPGGSAFLHHSNLRAFVVDGVLTVPNAHWRATSVDAALLREHAPAHGLAVVAQELVQWGAADTNDCFTLLRRLRPGEPAPSPRTWRHPDFGAERTLARTLGGLYRGDGAP